MNCLKCQIYEFISYYELRNFILSYIYVIHLIYKYKVLQVSDVRHETQSRDGDAKITSTNMSNFNFANLASTGPTLDSFESGAQVTNVINTKNTYANIITFLNIITILKIRFMD